MRRGLTENGRDFGSALPWWDSLGRWHQCQNLRCRHHLLLPITPPDNGARRGKGGVFRSRHAPTDVNMGSKCPESAYRHIG